MTKPVLPLLLSALLAACRSNAMTIAVKAPSSVVVTYRSGHNFIRRDAELRTAAGDVVRPAEVEHTSVELHLTTKYYVLAPGTYRLVNHRTPLIKALRPHAPRLMPGDRVTSDRY